MEGWNVEWCEKVWVGMKTEERMIKLSHIFEKWLWQHCSHSSLFFPFFPQCTLSNCYSGQLLLKQIESFQLLLKHLRKKDRRWLLLIIKKRARPKAKRSGADHTLNQVTSRLPVTRLVLHCLPHEETLLLFTSPPACRSCMTQPLTWRSSRLAERSALFLTLKPEPFFSATWLTSYRLLFAAADKSKKLLCSFCFVFSSVSVDKKTELWERRQRSRNELLLWDLPEDKGILSSQSMSWAFVSNKEMFGKVAVRTSIFTDTVKILSPSRPCWELESEASRLCPLIPCRCVAVRVKGFYSSVHCSGLRL